MGFFFVLFTDLLEPYTDKTQQSIHSGYEPSLTAALVVDGVADITGGGLNIDWSHNIYIWIHTSDLHCAEVIHASPSPTRG